MECRRAAPRTHREPEELFLQFPHSLNPKNTEESILSDVNVAGWLSDSFCAWTKTKRYRHREKERDSRWGDKRPGPGVVNVFEGFRRVLSEMACFFFRWFGGSRGEKLNSKSRHERSRCGGPDQRTSTLLQYFGSSRAKGRSHQPASHSCTLKIHV